MAIVAPLLFLRAWLCANRLRVDKPLILHRLQGFRQGAKGGAVSFYMQDLGSTQYAAVCQADQGRNVPVDGPAEPEPGFYDERVVPIAVAIYFWGRLCHNRWQAE
jgi:hypothetical protein